MVVLHLGRWVILAGMCCEAVGGGGRVWKSGNLLVEFDDAGLVKRTEPFDDKKSYLPLTLVAENSPLQSELPMEIPVKYLKNNTIVPATVVLSKDSLGIEETSGNKKRYKFSVPRDLVKIQTSIFLQSSDPTYVGWRIHCKHDLRQFGGPRGKDLNVDVTVPQLVTLMSYMRNTSQADNVEARPENK